MTSVGQLGPAVEAAADALMATAALARRMSNRELAGLLMAAARLARSAAKIGYPTPGDDAQHKSTNARRTRRTQKRRGADNSTNASSADEKTGEEQTMDVLTPLSPQQDLDSSDSGRGSEHNSGPEQVVHITYVPQAVGKAIPAPKVVERQRTVPQSSYIDKVAEEPVPSVNAGQKHEEVPQIHDENKAVTTPMAKQGQAPLSSASSDASDDDADQGSTTDAFKSDVQRYKALLRHDSQHGGSSARTWLFASTFTDWPAG